MAKSNRKYYIKEQMKMDRDGKEKKMKEWTETGEEKTK